MASPASHRPTVVPEVLAVIPRLAASAAMSRGGQPRRRHAQLRRQLAGQGPGRRENLPETIQEIGSLVSDRAAAW